MNNFTDYIVFVDESGDHGLKNINKDYPIFVLAFCIFKIDDYLKATTNLQKFKFKHWGEDTIVLHESEIRRDTGDFSFLRDKEKKSMFMSELTQIIDKENFAIRSVVINKQKLLNHCNKRGNDDIYHLSMFAGVLEVLGYIHSLPSKDIVDDKKRITKMANELGYMDKSKLTHIIFEARGKKEDKELQDEFNSQGWNDYCKLKTVSKTNNEIGLQITDLIARPIGISALRPKQSNKAVKIIKKKDYKTVIIRQ